MEKANGYLIKDINLNLVRQAMKQIGTGSKSQLAALTKLSVVTINSLVKELVQLGELSEDETVPSNGADLRLLTGTITDLAWRWSFI